MDSRQLQNGERKERDWLKYINRGSVFVNSGLFDYGLVAIKPVKQQSPSENYSISNTTFTIKDREFSFWNVDSATTKLYPQNIKPALSKLITFINKNKIQPKQVSIFMLSEMPISAKPNSFFFIRDEKLNWQCYLVDERGEKELLDIAEIPFLDKALKNLPSKVKIQKEHPHSIFEKVEFKPEDLPAERKIKIQKEKSKFERVELKPENLPAEKIETIRQAILKSIDIELRPSEVAFKTASNLLTQLIDFSNNKSKDGKSTKINILMLSTIPDKLEPFTYLLVRDEAMNWQAYLTNEAGEKELLNLSKLPWLATPLKNLPKKKLPEEFSQEEKEPVLKAIEAHQSIFIYNSLHREEIFLPFEGLYLFPWQSKHDDAFMFTGFEEVVTAGCLFGACLKGSDQHGFSTALIKHDITFPSQHQKIEYIDFDFDKANPYEEMLLKEFEKQVALIKKFSALEKPKLRYHLPYFDYILFGVELFVRGRITLHALDELFFNIFKKKNRHMKRIQDICALHGVDVIVESPFANLFGPINSSHKSNLDESDELESHEESVKGLATIILDKLNLSHEEVDPSKIEESTQKANEMKLVKYCLEKLQNNTFKPEYATVWRDFISSVGEDQINNLEDLFKLANAVVLGVAARGKNDFKVCSLLPLSEKQIQVSYDVCSNLDKNIKKLESKISKFILELDKLNAEYSTLYNQYRIPPRKESGSDKDPFKQLFEKSAEVRVANQQVEKLEAELQRLQSVKANLESTGSIYPAVFNLTAMDQFLIYGHKNKGLAFYTDFSNETVSALISNGILDSAHGNTANLAHSTHSLFARKKPNTDTVKLQDFISIKSRSLRST